MKKEYLQVVFNTKTHKMKNYLNLLLLAFLLCAFNLIANQKEIKIQ
jgi:hypothetical protein